MVRSEGLEPPRFYSLPPQGSASTNSATSAWDTGWSDAAGRINGADVTNRRWGDKASFAFRFNSPDIRRFRQHLLDFDRDTVAIDQHHAAGDRQVVGEDLDLVRLGGVQFDDGAAATAASPDGWAWSWCPRTTMRSTVTLSRVGHFETAKLETEIGCSSSSPRYG